MKSTTITIIIPVFNVENVVEETLLSVKNQTSSSDEVIIIDDGSTDDSINIINNFKNLKGWKIIQTPNQGLGLTRNLGRSIAKSDYVYFLDSDDIIKNNLINRMREIIQQYNKPDMILFSGESFDDNHANNKKPNLKFTLQGEYFHGSRLITKLTKKKEILPQASRYITKVKLWTENKLMYPKGIAEDEAVFFPLLALSKSTVVIPESYYKYRVGRPGSITSGFSNPEHARDFLNRIKFSMEFMIKKYDLIKTDLSAWHYRLTRKGLNYVSMCLKTKVPIDWMTMLVLFYTTKNISFPFKLFWRFLRHFFKISLNKNLKK
ncbi:glycosyltransferase family 2 protein [Candidatus Pelagibacter sp.]|nr:glycosyltransferase family 2 protein [Candidatus Pelagibacter sp.]